MVLKKMVDFFKKLDPIVKHIFIPVFLKREYLGKNITKFWLSFGYFAFLEPYNVKKSM